MAAVFCNVEVFSVARGAEAGRFRLGSTIGRDETPGRTQAQKMQSRPD